MDGRRFAVAENYGEGDFDASVTFDYRQSGDLVWATFRGDQIRLGNIVGRRIRDGLILLKSQYVHSAGDLKSGTIEASAWALPDGRVRADEWWTAEDGSTGTSAIEEVRP